MHVPSAASPNPQPATLSHITAPTHPSPAALERPQQDTFDRGGRPCSTIILIPVRSQLRAQDPQPRIDHAVCVPHHNTDDVMYALPNNTKLTKDDFRDVQTRDLFARCLAHQHKSNPKHENQVGTLVTADRLISAFENFERRYAASQFSGTAFDITQFSRTTSHLVDTLTALSRGKRIEGDYNFYPEELQIIPAEQMVATTDERQYGQYAWFEPLGRLAHTASLSVADTLGLADAYMSAYSGAPLTHEDQQAMMLQRYCLNLTYYMHAEIAEARPLLSGQPVLVPPMRTVKCQRNLKERLLEDQAHLSHSVPRLDLV